MANNNSYTYNTVNHKRFALLFPSIYFGMFPKNLRQTLSILHWKERKYLRKFLICEVVVFVNKEDEMREDERQS